LAEPAPLTGVDRAPVPGGGAGEWFVGAGDFRLRAALFPALGAPRGTVVVSGGRTETIEKYFEVVEELRARGFTVLVHDWRGQGLSQRLLPERWRGHAAGYDDFVADFAALLAVFETRLPKPWLMVSHSMGGCITGLALARGETRFAAACFSAPMWGLISKPWPMPVAVGLARAARAVGVVAGMMPGYQVSPIAVRFEDNVLTHDRARFERDQAQIAACPDLALGGPTWGWVNSALDAINELQRGPGTPRIAIPVTVVAAGDDRLVDIDGQRRVTARIPKGRFVEVPGAFHEILQETDDIRAVFWREFDALADAAAPRAKAA